MTLDCHSLLFGCLRSHTQPLSHTFALSFHSSFRLNVAVPRINIASIAIFVVVIYIIASLLYFSIFGFVSFWLARIYIRLYIFCKFTFGDFSTIMYLLHSSDAKINLEQLSAIGYKVRFADVKIPRWSNRDGPPPSFTLSTIAKPETTTEYSPILQNSTGNQKCTPTISGLSKSTSVPGFNFNSLATGASPYRILILIFIY